MGSNRLYDRAVEVRVNGEWFAGWLDPDNWRREGDRWVAWVRWQSAPAENRSDTFDQDDVRWL